MTKDEFIEQADAICADTLELVAPIFETALAAGAELVKAAAGGDEAAMAALESDDPVAAVERRVRDDGMTICGGDE